MQVYCRSRSSISSPLPPDSGMSLATLDSFRSSLPFLYNDEISCHRSCSVVNFLQRCVYAVNWLLPHIVNIIGKGLLLNVTQS